MVTILKLAYVFFKVGLFGFGGGYAILPMIFQEIQKFGMMSAAEFSNLVALSQMTPGPIAINASTYVGYKAAGMAGAIVATLAVIVPSFIIINIVIAFLNKFRTSPVITAVLRGIKPATVGLIASAVIFFSQTSIFKEGISISEIVKKPLDYISLPAVFIFALTILLTKKFKIGPITMTVLAAVIGAFIF